MAENNIIRTWNSRVIRFQDRNGQYWLSLTDMAQATGKRVNDWLRLSSTTEYLTALSDFAFGDPIAVNPAMTKCQGFEAFLDISKGGDVSSSGTWAIEEVAIDFAQWCNVHFRIWVNRQIKELASAGKDESHRKKLPPMSYETMLEMQKLLFEIADKTNDKRALITLQSSLQNALMPAQFDQETKEELLSVTEICERHGIRIPKGKDSVIGRKVAALWRSLNNDKSPQACSKHVGTGHHSAEVKIYPQEFFDRIIAIAQEYL